MVFIQVTNCPPGQSYNVTLHWSFTRTHTYQNTANTGYFSIQGTKHPSFYIFNHRWNLISFPEGHCIFSFLSLCRHMYVLLVLVGAFSIADDRKSLLLNQNDNLWAHSWNVRGGAGSYFKPGSEPRPRKCHFETRAFSLHFNLLLGCLILGFHKMVPSNSRLISFIIPNLAGRGMFFPGYSRVSHGVSSD